MKHQLNTLAFFASKGAWSWHTFNHKCRVTKNAVKKLEEKGFLLVNWELNQATFTAKTMD